MGMGLRLQISDWQTQGRGDPRKGPKEGTPRVMRGTNKAFGESVREKKEVLRVMCVCVYYLSIGKPYMIIYVYVNPYTTHILY